MKNYEHFKLEIYHEEMNSTRTIVGDSVPKKITVSNLEKSDFQRSARRKVARAL